MKFLTILAVSVLFGILGAKAQNCDELWKECVSLCENEKYAEAEKVKQRLDECGDNDLKSKSDELMKPVRAVQRKAVKASVLTLSYEDVSIPHQGGEFPVKVSGTRSWKAEVVESDWCSVRKEGNTIVIACPNENPSMQNRVANVIVTSGSRSKTIVVTNEGAPETLRSSVSNIYFPFQGGRDSIGIYSNTSWTINHSPEWAPAVRKGNHIEINAEPNKQNRERLDSVLISTDSLRMCVVKLYQGAGNEKLFFSKNNLSFGPDGGDEYIKVYTNADGWRFGDFPHWCQVTRIGNDSIKIHCTPNDPIDMVREASVNVTTGFQTLGIKISQGAKPYPFMMPSMGIGGRALSIGINAGYLMPMISTSCDGSFTGSAVNYALGNNGEEASYKTGGGFNFGLFADIRLYRNIYMIVGINYLQYSYNNEFKSDVDRRIYQTESYYLRGNTQNKYKEEYTMSQLEMPILASYRFPVTKKSHVQVNLGPVLNCGLSAKLKVSGYTDSESMSLCKIVNGQLTEETINGGNNRSIHYAGKGEFDLYDTHIDYIEKRESDGAEFDKSLNLDDSPLRNINIGMRAGLAYEYYGISIGIEFTYWFTNVANPKYWEGDRWKIFDQSVSNNMIGYRQRNHYLGLKLGYTLRY